MGNILLGKHILLTGASGGIGKKIAHELDNESASLILIARNKNALIKLTSELKGNHKYFSLDVSDTDSVKDLFSNINEQNIKLNGIINCAGSFGAIGKLGTVYPSSFFNTIKLNLLATYNICFFGIKLLTKNPIGKIINFSGGGATSEFPNYSGYACSKVAIVKLTENLAYEYPEYDINVVAPGFIKSPLALQTLKAGKNAGEFLEKTKKMLNNGGIDVNYVLKLIVFLLSEKSNGITGKLLSAPWDKWCDTGFKEKLKKEKDFCTLRRIDGKYFYKM